MIVFRSLISIPWTGRRGGRSPGSSQSGCRGRQGLCSVAICQMTPSVTKYGLNWRHCILTSPLSSLCVTNSSSLRVVLTTQSGLLSSQTEVFEKHATLEIIAIFLWTYFMIKFWYFVIQFGQGLLHKFLNRYLGSALGGLPTLFANIKQTQDSGPGQITTCELISNDLPQIFHPYAMTNKFLPRMEMELMPCSQQSSLCVLQSWYRYLQTSTHPPADYLKVLSHSETMMKYF